jgi:hypothetical protein
MLRLLAIFCLLASAASAGTYYVDCASGSDNATATSATAAWKSTAKVSATTFAPGDSILFRRGVRCAGSLWPKGSGQDGMPIRIGAYGDGPLPVLNAGQADASIKLFDQQYWEIENLETSGGTPYGVYVGASPQAPALHHFVLRNLVVHDVGGTPKRKESGLVVFAGPFEGVLIDGVTAYATSQWAGIYVCGSKIPARNVTVCNSIVHDVDGDGIVLFQTENGIIEKSAAWHTGLQEKETIGTPNAIWTWTCRNCVVQQNEGFWIDSPGVDGGIYDIDWANDDNVVQHNYGHDAQGYCAAVFGAGKHTTTNSIVRYNVCVNNGRSPKLARRQGDLFTSTWDGGSLDGVLIEHNTFVWNPPINAPPIQMSGTAFTGARPNIVASNLVFSSVASLVRAAAGVKFENNLYWHPGAAPPLWSLADRQYTTSAAWREAAPSDRFADPKLDWLLHPLESMAGIGAVSSPPAAISRAKAPAALPRSGRDWLLLLFAGKADPDARSQLVFLQTALAQYHDTLAAAVIAAAGDRLQYDWNFGSVESIKSAGIEQSMAVRRTPALMLVSPAGEIVRRWDAFAPPADLGLTLKHYLGSAPGNPELNIGQKGKSGEELKP